jgi:putative selenate reductase
MLERLRGVAARAGRTLGVKLTNTLVVKNTRGKLAGEHAYLSGPPLHAIAVTLAGKLAEATAGAIPLSFSAGADAENFADLVACGFAPVTTCTDLLQPTGYRRLPRYLKALETEMERLAVRDVASYVSARAGADAAPALANLRAYAARVADEPRYAAAAQPAPAGARAPLPVLDCESCNNCALVCPNVAFFAVDTPPELLASGALKREKQWILRSDACNACGNCDTHCPQEGGPWRVKPAVDAEGRVSAEGVGEAVRAALEGAVRG